MMKERIEEAFWAWSTQFVEWIVPITAITIVISLFLVALYGGNRRV